MSHSPQATIGAAPGPAAPGVPSKRRGRPPGSRNKPKSNRAIESSHETPHEIFAAPKPKRAQRSKRAEAPEAAEVNARMGKDVLGLVEYPFAALGPTGPAVVLEQKWDVKDPATGKVREAAWKMSGSVSLGLPTPTDERVYLVLMELSRELGFPRTVSFTCYGLLKRLGWRDDRDSYTMLRQAFERLSSVMITTRNIHWSEKNQRFYDTAFSLIQGYLIEAEEPGRKRAGDRASQSHFIWNEFVHDTISEGKIRSIDLDFALSLARPMSLRLFRYLDKKTYDGKGSFEIELHRLCETHLGMTPAPYNSQLKQRLKPAHDELRDRGFLVEVTYAPMKTRDGEKVRYTFSPGAVGAAESVPLPSAPGASTWTVAASSSQPVPFRVISSSHKHSESGDAAPGCEREELLGRMVALKVSPEVARDLLQSASLQVLRLQLDCLHDRVPKDPAAVFVKAVREEWEAPQKYLERVEAAERAQKRRAALESAQALKTAQKAAEDALKASQQDEARQLDENWEQLAPEVRSRIEDEARQRLGVLGQAGRAQAALAAMKRTLLREMTQAQ